MSDWPNDMRFLWEKVLVGILLLSILWVLVAIGSLIYSAAVPTSQQDASDYAGEVNSLAKEIDKAKSKEEFPEGVKPESNCGPWWTAKKFIMDIFTDLFSILNLVATGNVRFAVALTIITTSSLTEQLISGTNVCVEASETARQGKYTDKYLHLLRHEQGYEAFFSTALTLYAFPFANITGVSFFTGIVSILLAINGIATRVHQELDLLNSEAGVGRDGVSGREAGALLSGQ